MPPPTTPPVAETSLLLEALTPDRLALALAALGELENEVRALERQWSLKRERARYEAERARRQYDAVEPENRLVARSLERVWEDRLRQVEQIDAEYSSYKGSLEPGDYIVRARLGEASVEQALKVRIQPPSPPRSSGAGGGGGPAFGRSQKPSGEPS